MAEIARLHPAEDKSFRLAPHNVEAEQALLGAVLVNNEAFYRVSDFLEPIHFYEPIHREIYEVIGKFVRAGKSADPITIKTHLPENLLADMTMAQYLARLAAEATTVLNAADYGRMIHDLALRRSLILIGEEMVSTAYESEVDVTPEKQIEEVEGALFQLAEKGRYDGGFQPFNAALKDAIQMAGRGLWARWLAIGHGDGAERSRPADGRIAAFGLDHPRGAPCHGQDGAGDQYRLPCRQGMEGRRDARRAPQDRQWRHCRLLQPGNEFRAAGDAYPGRTGADFLVRHPARQYP